MGIVQENIKVTENRYRGRGAQAATVSKQPIRRMNVCPMMDNAMKEKGVEVSPVGD